MVAEVTKPRSGAELTELVNTAASDEDGLEEVQVQLDEVFKQLCVQLGPIASEERERREMELWTLLYERLPTAGQGVPNSVARHDGLVRDEDMREAASMYMLVVESLYSGVTGHVLSPAEDTDGSKAWTRTKRRIKVIPRLVVQ